MDIDDLYALIPDVPCPSGCIACCADFGVPSRTAVEDERLRAFLKASGRDITPAVGTRCPYVSENGCTVHPVRPFTCRMYGAAPNSRCFKKVQPVELLHEDLEEELWHLYRVNFF